MINDNPGDGKAAAEANQVNSAKLAEYVHGEKVAANSTGIELTTSSLLPKIALSDGGFGKPAAAQEHLQPAGYWENDSQKNRQLVSNLYDSAHSVFGDSLKLLGSGYGLYLLEDHPYVGSMALAGVAGLSAYDDFRSLRDQTTFGGVAKYTGALLSDAAMGAGAVGLMATGFKNPLPACLLVGGMLERLVIGTAFKK